MKCPKCGSEQCQFATRTSGGNFSGEKGCCGYILLGPIGILCGALGNKETKEDFWVCTSCGHRFEQYESEYAEQLRKKQEKKQQKQQENLKQKYDEYKQEIHNADELKSEIEDFDKLCQQTMERRKKYLEELIKNNDDKGKLAKILKSKSILWAVVLLAISIILLFVAFPIGAIMIVISIIWAILSFEKDKKASAKLCEIDEEFKNIEHLIKKLEDNSKKYNQVREKVDFIKEYENK